MYENIIDPTDGKPILLNSKEGKALLNNYLKFIGGCNSGLCKSEKKTLDLSGEWEIYNYLYSTMCGIWKGYYDPRNNIFYYANKEMSSLAEIKILESGLFSQENYNIETGHFHFINEDKLELNFYLIFNPALDEKYSLEYIKNIILNGNPLLGGKSRAFVKTDHENKIVVKTAHGTDINEYINQCKYYTLNLPINPPIIFLQNVINGNKYIAEPAIEKTIHSEDFIKATYDEDIYYRVQSQFNTLVKNLKEKKLGGDFKLDNILFKKDGSFILTDLVNDSKDLTWEAWEEVAKVEGGKLELYINFDYRLKYYLSTLLQDGRIMLLSNHPVQPTIIIPVTLKQYEFIINKKFFE